MSSGRRLRKKLNYVILIPILMALVLAAAAIWNFGIDTKESLICLGIVAAFVVIVIVVYIKLLPSISATMVDYSLEQGKIQKEMLHGLAVPYAIMDTDGRVLWANAMFHKMIGIKEKKYLQHRLDHYIPELSPAVFEETEGEISMDVEFNEHRYNAVIRRMDLSTAFDGGESKEGKNDDIVVVMYLFDVTREKKLEQENEDQKLIAGLAYIDNYDEVMDSMEEVKHSILTALVDRKINVYLSNIDAIVKRMENDKYLFVFPQKYMQSLRSDRFSLLDCRFSERRVVKSERLQKILVSAMKQSHKAWLPVLDEIMPFQKFITRPDLPAQRFIAHCYEDESAGGEHGSRPPFLLDVLQPHTPALVLIGPEGDFSIDEVHAAESAGFRSISLGTSRLRTETAALAAVHMMRLANR